MKTLCICVLRNGLSMTRPAVKSILAQTEPCDLLLIDNASNDGTAAWMRTIEQQSNVTGVSLSEQVPLAAAWNKGLKNAFAYGYDAAWVVNSDVLFRPDTLKWLNEDPHPFTTCVSVRTEEQLNVEVVNPSERARPNPDYSCWRMNREMWEAGMMFDEDFIGAYLEDCAHDLLCRKNGYVNICIDVPFLHYGSGTILNADPIEKRKVQQAAQRNRERFRHKWGVDAGSPEYYALLESLTQSAPARGMECTAMPSSPVDYPSDSC